MTQTSPSILLAEIPGRKPIGSPTALSVAAVGGKVVSVAGIEQAIKTLQSSPIRIVISNDPNISLFETARQCSPKSITMLVTDLPMEQYCAELGLEDQRLLDHVIGNFDTEWATTDLAITLQKIIRSDFFGIEKYLSPNAAIQSRIIKGSAERESSNKSLQEWVEACGLGKNLMRLASGICEEMLMNAIFDAPVAGGRTHYESMERRAARELAQDEWAELKWGADGRNFAIAIADPFGAFERERWFSYLRKALKRSDSEGLIDTKKGGAGLGLFKMLYSSHGIICNVDPGKKTEVIALISVQHPMRDITHVPRSMHYFNTVSHGEALDVY